METQVQDDGSFAYHVERLEIATDGSINAVATLDVPADAPISFAGKLIRNQ